jgi:Ca-activated chloride channel family protein
MMSCVACGGASGAKPVVPKAEPRKLAEEKADQQIAAAEKVVDLLTLTADAERSVIVAGQNTDMFVRVRLTANDMASSKRPSINLALVVDTSGSMRGEAIANARQACLAVVDSLKKGDQLTVVTFGSRAEVLVPLTVLDGMNAKDVHKKIRGMTANGTTNMGAGLQLGLNHVQQRMLPNGINRIVLLGDGVPNDANPVRNVARQAGRAGVSITSLGLGIEYDETLMNLVAQTSGGTFHFIDTPAKVAAVFNEEVSRLERVVAKQGWLELTAGPGVQINSALGLVGGWSGSKYRIQLGDLSEGQTREVMLHVTVASHRDGATVELFDASFRYNDQIHDLQNREVNKFVSLQASHNQAAITEGRHPDIEHKATRFRVADLFVRAIASARGGHVPTAKKLLQEAEQLARAGAKRFDDEELAEKAVEARTLRNTIASLAPPPPPRHHRGGMGSGGRRPAVLPTMSAPEAMHVRRAHGSAMKTINGR